MPVAAYGYDAFMMAVFLKSRGALSVEGVANVGGYKGINGLVRLNKDGTNNRLLDIYQINSYGRPQLVEAAAENFEERPQQWFWKESDTQSIADVQVDLERQKQQAQEKMEESVDSVVVESVESVSAGDMADEITSASEEESGY